MAIHIQMNEEAERELKRASFRNKLSAILSCLLFLGLGTVILTVIAYNVMKSETVQFTPYKAPEKKKPNAPNKKKKNQEQSDSQSAAPSLDMPAMKPLVNQNSPVSINAPVPQVSDMGEGLSPSPDIGDGFGSGDFGDGFGSGDGGGLGGTEGGGSTLEGTFYDLKKDSKGKSTGIVPGNQKQVVEALHEFFATWQENKLNKYYRSKQKLYASSWYLPVGSADYGPIAFGVGDPKEKDKRKWECEPSAWLAVYRGKVIAPKDGYFRFIGTGDDFFAVRFNNKLALTAGYRIATDFDKKSSDDCFIYHGDANVRADRLKKFLAKHKGFSMITGVPGCQIWDQELSGLVAGAPFKVEEFKEYPIEIAIAEIPGGKFGFILFIEEVDSKGNPIEKGANKKYDLFRTCDENPDPDKIMQALKDAGCFVGDNRIPFNEEAWTWECPIEED